MSKANNEISRIFQTSVDMKKVKKPLTSAQQARSLRVQFELSRLFKVADDMKDPKKVKGPRAKAQREKAKSVCGEIDRIFRASDLLHQNRKH